MKIITFGTFDLFHIGHLNILKRAKELGDILIVGISTDELTFKKKNKKPIMSLKDRMDIISSIKYVDDIFIEESLEEKVNYIKKYKANIFVIGDDWKGYFDDELNNICDIIYLPRTKNISTSSIINNIKIN